MPEGATAAEVAHQVQHLTILCTTMYKNMPVSGRCIDNCDAATILFDRFNSFGHCISHFVPRPLPVLETISAFSFSPAVVGESQNTFKPILGFSFGRAWVVEGAEEAAAVGAAFGANGIRMGAGAVKSNVRFDNEGTALA